MFRRIAPSLALIAALGLPAAQLRAEGGCSTDAMLVFDGSNSMQEFGFDARQQPRIAEAGQAIATALPRVAPFRRIGLLVYGPNTGDACTGIDLRFAPRANAAGPVIDAVNALRPAGLTPLAASVQAAADVLTYQERAGVIVVVTDGNETCGGRPCALAAGLAERAQDLTIHVIGFRVLVDYWTWDNPEQEAHYGDDTVARCLADATGGLYVTAETVDDLVGALQQTLGCPLFGMRQRAVLPG